MKITKREVLFSIIILAIMLILGIFINTAIENYNTEKNEVYYLATKIDNDNEFQYGVKTSIGNTLSYGTMRAVNPVSMPEINGKYFYIEKVIEKYNRHTRTEVHTVNGRSYTKTVVYYSWDYYNSEFKKTNEIDFMGVKFNNPINGLPYERIDLSKYAVDKSNVRFNYIYNDGFFESVGDTREYYNIVPIEFTGTLEAKLSNNSLQNFNEKEELKFHENKTIDQTVEEIENNGSFWVIGFRIIWIILTIILIGIFYYFDNRWLE